jgi:hypothetical protein
LAACAADIGDAAKMEGVIVPVGEDGSVQADTGQPGQDQSSSSLPPSPEASTLLDATNPSEATVSSGDSSLPPEDGGTADDGPASDAPPEDAPPADDGGGCSAGATVITTTDPSSGSAAGTVGNFNTTGAVCVKLLGGIVSQYGGWNSSNVTGRTVTLNGVMVPVAGAAGAVPPGPDGYAIWEWTAGADLYASMSLY